MFLLYTQVKSLRYVSSPLLIIEDHYILKVVVIAPIKKLYLLFIWGLDVAYFLL